MADEKDIPSQEELDGPDWKASNKITYFNSKKKHWFCIECEEIFDNPKAAAVHVEKIHQMSLGATHKSVNTGPSKRTKELEEQFNKTKTTPEDDVELDKTIGHLIELDSTSQAQMIHSIIDHPYIKYTYYQLRAKKYIYPYWTMADWLRECVQMWIQRNGVEIKCDIPKERIAQDRQLQSYLIDVSKEWDSFTAEEKLLEQKNEGIIEVKHHA